MVLLRHRRLITFIVLFCWIVSCSTATSLSPKSIAKTPSLQLGCSYDWAGWWPWAVAQEQRLFAANGANIELQWFDDYYRALDALAAGEIDANCQVFNDTIEMANQASDGEVIILVTDNSAGNDKIISTHNIQTLGDLPGTRVGVEKGKLTDFLLGLALASENIDRSAVDIQYMGTTSAAIMFVAQQLDAIVAWQPEWITALRRSDSHELLSSKDIPGAIPQVVAVTQAAIDQRAEDLQALINTWFDTLTFIQEHPDISRDILKTRSQLPELNYQRFTEGVHIFSPAENEFAFTSGRSLEHLSYTAEKAAHFLIQAGQISQLPDLDKLLDDRFVRAYGNSKTSRS